MTTPWLLSTIDNMDKIERAKKAIKFIGQTRLAKACKVKQPTVHEWTKRGLPRTEWTGETDYSSTIEKLSEGWFTKDWMLTGETEAKQ